MTLTIFNGTTAVGSFSLGAPVQFSAADLALEPGNGSAVFDFVLSASQQTAFNTLLASFGGGGTLRAGLAATLGCAAGAPASCQPSNDGPDSFVGFAQPGHPVLAPEPGTLLLLGTGLVGLAAFARKKLHR